jgi:hypothetical protein
MLIKYLLNTQKFYGSYVDIEKDEEKIISILFKPRCSSNNG